jgi:ketosteroid isomerase-like protein
MELSRRDLAVAGAFALGAASLGATSLIGPALAESGDDAAVKKAVEDMRTAYLKQDKAALESMTLPQLTYSHSDGRIEDKAKFIEGVMNRKATVKSLEYPDLTVAVAGDTAIVRHLWVSESELEGKTTNTKIGVMQVYKKQDGGWKLLARSSYRLPDKA